MGRSFIDKVCDSLLEKGLLTDADLKRAREIYTEKGGKLTDILVKLNIVTREDILRVQSEAYGFPSIDLSQTKIEEEVLKLIPKRVCMLYQVLPVSVSRKQLTVAMVDPTNIFALDDLKAVTKMAINPVIADRDDMQTAIENSYERSATEEISEIVEGISGSEMEMVSKGEDEEMSSGELLKIMEETPVIKLTNLIVSQGVKEKASDILVEPMEKEFRVRYRIDGILHERQSAPKKYHCPLISRLKVMSNLNIAERRLPQDGRFQLKVADRNVDFRLSILPSITGEKACLRILDKEQVMIDINKLGIKERDLKKILAAGEMPHGMILSCGPTGSGKTTTLYSLLKYIDSPTKNLVTVEDPVEYEIKGINQVNVNSDIGLTFAGSLRSILRQDPDVILIGEIRDYETVDIAIKAALTGHLVLSTIHTNTASGSIVRLMNMGVEPFLIASSVILIVAQRLVRRLCPECKEAYVPTETVAKKYGLYDKNGDIATIYRPKGCGRCFNFGYKGRVALVECLQVTQAIKALLFKRAGEGEIENKAREEGMVTLRMNGIENVVDGMTSLEEVLRITAQDRKVEQEQ